MSGVYRLLYSSLYLALLLSRTVLSISICSTESQSGRIVSLTGSAGPGNNCRCTLTVKKVDNVSPHSVTYVQQQVPVGCEKQLQIRIDNVVRSYSCAKHGDFSYFLYLDQEMFIELMPGSTSSGGFTFAFEITSVTVGSEIDLSCKQLLPNSTTPNTAITTASTTTSTSTTPTTTPTSTASTTQLVTEPVTSSSTSNQVSTNSPTTPSGGEQTTTVNPDSTVSTASGGVTTEDPVLVTTNDPSLVTTDNNNPGPKTTIKAPAPSGTTSGTPVSVAAIVGSTVGVILLFVVLAVVLMCAWNRKLKKNKVDISEES